jgi:hypothetical protein
MKHVTGVLILSATMLLFVPQVHAQDLSKYRTFSLGTSLIRLSQQIDRRPADADVIQQSPATIQELQWRPSLESDSVDKVVFSFFNATLYKIVATYNTSSTEGLTSELSRRPTALRQFRRSTRVPRTTSAIAHRAGQSPLGRTRNIHSLCHADPFSAALSWLCTRKG